MRTNDERRLPLPLAEQHYLHEVVRVVREHVADALVGVYLGGSAATGAYEPGTSDLDVQAVVARPLDHAALRAVADDLTHCRLPCPARRLDFVMYERSAVSPATRHPPFIMNFNTSKDAEDALYLEPREEWSHWSLLDIAMSLVAGRTLYGANLLTVFAPVPRVWQLEAISASLTWHQQNDVVHPDTILNACRGWRYAVTDMLGSKQDGVVWAQSQPDCPPVVEQAIEQRAHGSPVDADGAIALVGRITAVVQAAHAAERASGV